METRTVPGTPVPALEPHDSGTIRIRPSSIEGQALAAMREQLPPLTPVTAEEEPTESSERRQDTPHTIVMPYDDARDRATLTTIRGAAVGSTFSLGARETTLGRGSKATLLIDEPSVSRLHARITFDPAARAYVIEDLGSTNGTFVGGRPARRTALGDGDRVQLGGVQCFRFALLAEEEATLQRHLYEASMRDALTELPNRRRLFDHVALELEHACRARRDLGLLMIDVDDFKPINDRFGHAAGDQALRAVALVGAGAVRRHDLFARYGGEEFSVVLPGCSRQAAVDLAERLRSTIEGTRIEVGGGAVKLTVSVGVALLSECVIADGAELFARADARLYAAKMAGKNRVTATG